MPFTRARVMSCLLFFAVCALRMPEAHAALPSCPAGQEAAYYYQNGGNSLAQYSTYWRQCVESKVGGVAKGKTSKSAFDSALQSCDGPYTSTYENPLEWGSWNGIRNFRFCSCTDKPSTSTGAMACTGKQWRSNGTEPACYPSDAGYIPPGNGIWDVNAACRPCTTSLTLTGGGSVEATKTLTGQSVRVTGCYGNPVQDVVVQITVAPLDPVNGPTGKLRAEGSDPSVTGTTVYNGITNANGEARFAFVAPGSAGTQTLTAQCISQTCTPSPAGPSTITVTDCRTLSMEGGGTIEPDPLGALPNTTYPVQLVRVENCAGSAASGVSVAITLSVNPTSGFHPHGDAARPVGDLTPSSGGCSFSSNTWTCPTDSQGLVPFSFKPTAAAGKHTIEAHCVNASDHCSGSGSVEVIVKVEGIEQIPPSQYYVLSDASGNIGDNGKHNGLNHNLTPTATAALEQLAADYAQTLLFPELVPLYINDASLPWGGIFDVGKDEFGNNIDWVAPHVEHQRGTVVDVRANHAMGNVPEDRFDAVKRLAARMGIDAQVHCNHKKYAGKYCSEAGFDGNRHIHVRLINGNAE